MKSVRVEVSALTRQTKTVVVEVPYDFDYDQHSRILCDLVYKDDGEFVEDPEYWERGDTNEVTPEGIEPATHRAFFFPATGWMIRSKP